MSFSPDPQSRSHPLRELELVRDLEDFEGPILSEYRAKGGGGVYLQKWCARADGVTTYLIVRSDPRAIAEYLSGRITMRALFTEASDGLGFLAERAHGDLVNVRPVVLESVGGYLPEPHVRHDETLRPPWDLVPQSYLLPEEWDAVRLSELERNYVSATAFGYLTSSAHATLLPQSLLESVMNGGFSIANVFRTVRHTLPRARRPRTSSISLSSPGVLVIDTPVEMFDVLENALRALEGAAPQYRTVHVWSRLNSRAVERIPDDAHADLQALCSSLNVDLRKLFPPSSAVGNGQDLRLESRDRLLIAGKLVAAYYRMLWRVAKPYGGIEFTGVNPVDQGLEYQEEEDLFDEAL